MAAEVAVEVSATDDGGSGGAEGGSGRSGADLRAALLSACTDAVAVGECVALDSTQTAPIVALVHWRGRGRVRIEVGRSNTPGEHGVVRDLQFGSRDAPLDQWKAVGYAVGTLAGEVSERASPGGTATPGAPSGPSGPGAPAGGSPGTPGPAPSPAEAEAEARPEEANAVPADSPEDADSPDSSVTAEPPEADGPRTPSNSTPAHPSWSVAAGAVLADGLSAGEWRLGAFGRVARRFEGPFVTAALSYARQGEAADGLSAHWLTPSAGAGYRVLSTSWIAADLRAEIVGELVAAHVRDAASGREDDRSRWTPGFRAGADVVLPGGSVKALVGAEATARTNRTDVTVGRDVTATIDVLDFLVLAGVGLDL